MTIESRKLKVFSKKQFHYRLHHRKSKYAKNPSHHWPKNFTWNDDFYVVLHSNIQSSENYNNVFVWSWEEGRNPKFLYEKDVLTEYRRGFWHTNYFLYKNYFAVLPDDRLQASQRSTKSMLRVHDIHDNFKLIGSYDFPEHRRDLKRCLKDIYELRDDHSHLKQFNGMALAICRTPALTVFMFR